MSNTMSDTQKIEKLAELNRNRQKTYYQRNRQAILDKYHTEREQLKIMNTPPPPPEIIPTEFNLDMIHAVLNEKITNKNTKLKYCNDFKRIFKLSGITVFTGSLDEYIIIKKSIDDSKYSLSTKKGSFQSILVFIDYSKINIDTKVLANYNKCHKIYIIKCEDQTEKRKTDKEEMVIPFTEYKRRILEFFGSESKEYLIASLYNELTARDDYGALIIKRINPFDDGKCNFICINKSKTNCFIVLNTYKTSNLYGKIVRTFSPELCSLIVSYIERLNLADYLFPEEVESGLSAYIIDMNKKIGIDGGICYMRHSKVSEFLKRTDLTPEMRLQFSNGMMHSESMQQKYCDRDRRKGHLGLGTGVEEIWVVEKLCYSLQ
jgi:hypothetical protein